MIIIEKKFIVIFLFILLVDFSCFGDEVWVVD